MWTNKGEGRWFYIPDPEMPTLDYFDHGKAEGEYDRFIAVSQIEPRVGRDLTWWVRHFGKQKWFTGRVAASFIEAAVEAGVVVVSYRPLPMIGQLRSSSHRLNLPRT